MDVLVSAVSASPLVRMKENGPTKVSKQLEPASSDPPSAITASPPNSIQEPVAAPKSVAAPGRDENVADKNKESNKQEPPKESPSALRTIKRFVFEHDELSGLSVIKLMDSKGNVIMQVPPENYLRTIQLLQEMGGLDLQASSGDAENMKLTGLLISKKV